MAKRQRQWLAHERLPQNDPVQSGTEDPNDVTATASTKTVRAARPALIAAALLIALGGCARLGLTTAAAPAGPAETEAPPAEALPGLDYEVEITGVPEAELRELLEKTAHLVTLRNRPPSGLAGLQRRIEGDRERLAAALRSEGFYAAEVAGTIAEAAQPLKVTLRVSTGIQYLLADYDIQYQGAAPPDPAARPGLDALGLHIGMPARAAAIVAAQGALLETLSRRGHPLAKVLDRRTLVDHATTTMTVTLSLDAGPPARFGAATIEGLDSVEEDYVRGFIAWSPGQAYDSDKVERTRRALANTGLFGSVVVEARPELAPDGSLPIAIRVAEARHRSIGFGASFSTGEGFSGNVFWEHRNLLGRNEQLRLGLTAAQIEQILSARLRKPAFLHTDQDLVVEGDLSNRNTDAFDEQSVIGSAALERPWRENWQVSVGVTGEYSVLDDGVDSETFQLFGAPLRAAYDVSDDVLNPTRGARLALAVTPYTGNGGGPLLFGVASAVGTAYHALDRERRFVLAGRAKLGSIAGEETVDLPANKRFYAGGGGSIRGYEFQKVGPLDAQNDPLGGRSVIELNGEVRIRVSDDIGIVPFIDGGTVFDSTYPAFDETLRWAAGLGGRYFSAIGPIRLDVAIPLNRRDIDDSFQFYISLGQAF